MNFPNNPAVNDVFDAGGISFVWNGQAWVLISSETAGGGVPRGGIIMWSGLLTAIPPGWALCDGREGRPDLRGRFIIGAGGVYNVGDTGGAESVTLTEAQMPAHTHGVNLTTGLNGDHTHQYNQAASWALVPSSGSVTRGFLESVATPPVKNTGAGGAHNHTVNGNTGSNGGGVAHENRPPFFALAYIMRL